MIRDENDIVRHRPRFGAIDVAAFVRERYGLAGTLRSLPSDKDQNFLHAASDGTKHVVKIAHALEGRDFLEAQHEIFELLSAHDVSAPRVIRTGNGDQIASIEDEAGRPYLVRILTYLNGIPLADVRPHSSGLIESLGTYLGRLDAALASFDHPAAHRTYLWDLARAARTISEYEEYLTTNEERACVDRYADMLDQIVEPNMQSIRRGVIHNDANDYNVLVNGPENAARRVVGVIDFGDVVHSMTVGEAAVAAAYAGMGKADPLRTAANLVAAYHFQYPLREEEVSILYPLIGLRLSVSICISAFQRRLEPANDYLTVSRAPAIEMLTKWSKIHPRLAEYVFRQACGYEPCLGSANVAQWLHAHAKDAAPIVADADAPMKVFDFSVGSSEWSFAELTAPGRAADEIERRMAKEGAVVGIGRYDEVRIAYQGDQFVTPSERRTVHLGIDLFQPAGSIVRAPLDGIIHSFSDNDRRFDYGPTLILEHHPYGGPHFYTLYGHLSRSSLASLRRRKPIARGEPIGEIGAPAENGGWAPHLHFQIIADLLDYDGDFPGVAAPGRRDVWLSISPDPSLLAGVGEAGRSPRGPTADDLQNARARHVGPSLSISYQRPIVVSRGYMQYLYDGDGRRYLDSVNNVAHVGHSHPRVVEAVARSMRVLNTNTRYLYGQLSEYAFRLAATLPDPLEVCYIVNSGSEANDLALRIARAHTRRRDVVAVEHAYHGNLSALIDVSPYKFDGPGGSGRPPHTIVVPMLDPLRSAAGAVQGAVDIISGASNTLAAFIHESAMSCGGQIFYPEGYLRAVYAAVRDAGGLTIADEVQTGFGRMGTTFWAFELQGVVPDVVTMGKPIGNGHPLGAVVTTKEIGRSFDNGMEYFNTFGGNPVACSAGLAVLDVMQDEHLQAHARSVGTLFVEKLRGIMDRHPVIGDVRGSGLFLGIELLRNRDDASPAPQQTAYVVERMREKGILTSHDGPLHNVIKLKPPMVFDAANAEAYVEALDDILTDDFVRTLG